jgi:6-phosphogluconolactonase (cycloisomerase 2 family)
MNLHRIGRIAKASIMSLAIILGLVSCSRDYVVGYVYMTTAKSNPGVINQYSIDYQSGALTQIGSPVAAGDDPVRLISAPNGKFVYVINQVDSTVQVFAVQGDGTLASQHVYPITGTDPTALATDPAGNFLYVTFTYQTGYSASTPGPGGVSIFPINSDNSLGTPATLRVGNNPVGIALSYFNHFAYVLDQEAPPNATILGFSQNPTTGALTPVTGTTITTVVGKTVATGYAAGVVPNAIVEDPTSRFVYVTDQAQNQMVGYEVQSKGNLIAMVNGPFQTGLFPVNLTIDPRGQLIYVVNYNSDTIEGYQIDTATGTPTGAVGAFATATGVGPTCVAIDPALGVDVYVSNSLDNTITGYQLNPSAGGLTIVQNSPFPASGKPSCVAIVPNGSHASQIIQP